MYAPDSTSTGPVTLPACPAAHRARRVTATIAQAEALAQLCRDHGHPARVVVGRKRGTIKIKVADVQGRWWHTTLLECNRDVVRGWLGY
jgi:hypothetical protein